MQIILAIIAALTFGCGSFEGPKGSQGEKGEQGEMGPQGPKGEKGEQGPAGKDGKDGVAGKDGKDGVDGKDGEDAVAKTIYCELDWSFDEQRGQKLRYTVVKFVKGTVGASLVRTYYANDYTFRQTSSVLHAEGTEGNMLAEVGDAVMSAQLSEDETMAKFIRKQPEEAKEVACIVK